MKKTLLVTGGAGFIGSNLVLKALDKKEWRVINIDKLTYSGNLASLEAVKTHPDYIFIKEDICNTDSIKQILETYQPDAIIHLAAESHVDRSIDSPLPFIDTNIQGTFSLLEAARYIWKKYSKENSSKADQFRFLHISTDEVFGELSDNPADFFNEKTPYAPSSPYSASKAASDHLVRAWHRTYGLPALITNCSNNYGPRQFPEKLIPLMILNALASRKLPVYGKGLQIRDWLYVDDHAEALLLAMKNGKPGETYAIGGRNEKTNISVVMSVCSILDRLAPEKKQNLKSYADLITFVEDRPGHDKRYAIDASKIAKELGWKPEETFETGLEKTVKWYLENKDWWQPILDGTYQCQRLGVTV